MLSDSVDVIRGPPYDGETVRYPNSKNDNIDDVAQDDVAVDDTPTTNKQALPTHGIKRR